MTTYTGYVTEHRTNEPIYMANILIVGTNWGTVTNEDGYFELDIPDTASELQISFTGYVTQIFKIDKAKELNLILKVDCSICYFDNPEQRLFIKSGLVNMPLGIEFQSSIPIYLKSPTLKAALGYQTNRNGNKRLNAKLMLDHVFVHCDFNYDIQSSYSSTQYNNQLSAQRIDLSTTLNYNRTNPIIGFSRMDFDHSDKSFTSAGAVLGFNHSFYALMVFDIDAITRIYPDLMEYEITLKGEYRSALIKLNYYQVSEFRELTLGFGINL